MYFSKQWGFLFYSYRLLSLMFSYTVTSQLLFHLFCNESTWFFPKNPCQRSCTIAWMSINLICRMWKQLDCQQQDYLSACFGHDPLELSLFTLPSVLNKLKCEINISVWSSILSSESPVGQDHLWLPKEILMLVYPIPDESDGCCLFFPPQVLFKIFSTHWIFFFARWESINFLQRIYFGNHLTSN